MASTQDDFYALGMRNEVAFIGFGEAAMAFAADRDPSAPPYLAFDAKTGGPERDRKLLDYARFDVLGFDTPRAALRCARAALSLVTADRVLDVAKECASLLQSDALWLDMNSVAPQTKQRACALIEAAGGKYVDAAVMAPVNPRRRGVPVLLSGPHAREAEDLLQRLGFTDVVRIEGGVGAASSIKMIRSVMIKGIEALTAECLGAAQAAGVLQEILASLDASPPPHNWRERGDYNLERVLRHGGRRAAEMEEVARTLDALGIGAVMTRAAVARFTEAGRPAASEVPSGLEAKLSLMASLQERCAA